MTKLEHTRSLIGDSLKAKLARLDDLKPADAAARRAVMKANRGISFRAKHKHSHLVVENGRVELGSLQPGYFKLLNLNGDVLSEIYAAWVVTGSTRG